MLIDELCFVAGNDFSARAGLGFAGAVGDHHLQSFRRAERIENFDAKPLFKAMKQWRGKRFARGDGMTHAREVELAPVFAVMRQQSCIIRGHGEKKRGAVALDVSVDRSRSRAHGIENRCGAAAKREVAGISQAVGKKQARDAETAVALLHLQNAFGIQLAADDHIVMQMNAAFGGAGASRGVQPEGGFVFAGGARLAIPAKRRPSSFVASGAFEVAELELENPRFTSLITISCKYRSFSFGIDCT